MIEGSFLYAIISAVGSANFIFFAIYVLLHSKNRRENTFLSIFLFTYSLAILSKVFIFTYNDVFEYIKYWLWYIAYTVKGPCIYYYVLFLFYNYRFTGKDLIHIVPFLINLLVFIITGERINTFILFMFSSLFFVYMIYLIYLSYELNRIERQNISLKTTRKIIIIYTVIRIFQLFFWFKYAIALDAIGINVLFYYFMIKELKNRYFSDPPYRKEKYRTMNIAKKDLENNIKVLENYIRNKEKFLDNNLTLSKLSEDVGMQQYIISAIINSKYGMNFNEFINSFRVKRAMEILSDTANDNLTIAYISQRCGFNSTSSFNKAFIRNTGITPSTYRKGNGLK